MATRFQRRSSRYPDHPEEGPAVLRVHPAPDLAHVHVEQLARAERRRGPRHARLVESTWKGNDGTLVGNAYSNFPHYNETPSVHARK